MNTRRWIGMLVAIVIIVAGGVWIFAATHASVNPLPIDPRDSITSWNFQGAYSSATLAPQKETEIASFKAKLGKGQYPDYQILLAIGEDYELMGDGKDAYNYYGKSAEASSTQAALAFNNIGALMERLGAVNTAQEAYSKAVALNPQTELYQLAYLEFLTNDEPQSSITPAAFSAAKSALGSTTPDILIVEANWLTAIGSTTAAIADWNLVLPQVNSQQQAAIQSTIEKLKAKQ